MERRMRVVPLSPSRPLLVHGIVRHIPFLIIFFSSSIAADMSTFDYPDFKNYSGIRLYGNISIDGTGAIQLNNRDLDRSVGVAYYGQPIHLWNTTTGELADFTTTFTFGVSSIVNTSTGGGVAFFLSEDPTIPASSDGDLLGLMNGSIVMSWATRRFVAVEFDSYANYWDLPSSDCHVGIDVNSLVSVAIVRLGGNSFRPGPEGKAQVAYDSVSKNLSLSLDYNHTTYELSHVVDLRNELPQWVYVGFSLATDYSYDLKNITSWSFGYSHLNGPREPPPSPSPSPSPATVTPNNNNNNKNTEGSSTRMKTGVLVTVIAVPLLIMLIIGILCFLIRKFKRANGEDQAAVEANDGVTAPQSHSIEDPPPCREHRCSTSTPLNEDGGPRRIPFQHLVAATDNFHESRMLGKGASSGVYSGFLEDLNQEVAVKRIEEYSERGEKEFMAEIKAIGQSRHRNLVKLIGFCQEGRELLIVYDLMPNGSLDYHLFDDCNKLLSWSRRRNIALGVASALQYLHEGLDKCIVHRDVKPSNILLDSEFNAKLGDFGLARITNHGSSLQSTMMAGTMGYMAPEYILTGKASKEADIYSFGIVALELVSGRRAMEAREKGRETLVRWIWELHGKGTIKDAVDKRLEKAFNEHQAKQMIMVGLWCAHPEARCRPSFRQVLSALNLEIAVPDLSTNPSSIAQLSYLVSGMSPSAKSSDYYNDGESNQSQLTTSMGSCA